MLFEISNCPLWNLQQIWSTDFSLLIRSRVISICYEHDKQIDITEKNLSTKFVTNSTKNNLKFQKAKTVKTYYRQTDRHFRKNRFFWLRGSQNVKIWWECKKYNTCHWRQSSGSSIAMFTTLIDYFRVSLIQIVDPDGGDMALDEPLHCLQWQVLCFFKF